MPSGKFVNSCAFGVFFLLVHVAILFGVEVSWCVAYSIHVDSRFAVRGGWFFRNKTKGSWQFINRTRLFAVFSISSYVLNIDVVRHTKFSLLVAPCHAQREPKWAGQF